MELHKAIKSVIETDGQEIVKDVRLVNILSDFQAFDAIPASKYILRAVIADGYSQKLLAIGAWNSQSENLCNQFVATTGFQSDYVSIVFQSLAFGLGWLNQIFVNQNANNPDDSQQQNSVRQKKQPKLKKDQKEALILSKVRYLNNLKLETGVEIKNLSFELEDDWGNEGFCGCFNFEVHGKIDSNRWETVVISIALYDSDGKIRCKEMLWYGEADAMYRNFSIESVKIFPNFNLRDVGDICIFL